MIKLITHPDIGCDDVQKVIANELVKQDKFIYLTATMSLKSMRSHSPYLQGVLQTNLADTTNLFTISEFTNQIRKSVYSEKGCLSNADQKYILTKVLFYYYKDNEPALRAMYAVRHELFELYYGLLFNDVEVSETVISDIASSFSQPEANLFGLYQLFKTTIEDVIKTCSDGELSPVSKEILGDCSLRKNHSVATAFAQRQKQAISTYLDSVSAVILDGFLFFDDLQKFIIKTAETKGIVIYLISKQFADGTGQFILNDNLRKMNNDFGIKTETLYEGQAEHKDISALDYIKKNYPISNKKPDEKVTSKLKDGSIRVISPFLSREQELRYVVKSISNKLRNCYNGDISSVQGMLSDFAIVMAANKEQYEQRISNLFSEVGLFIYKGDDCFLNSNIGDIDCDSFEKVYFTKDEFLHTPVKTITGGTVPFADKLYLFKHCFYKIDINKHIRPISSYPIGQFVLRIYDTIQNGMSLEGFKCILYSNWQYNLGGTEIKWSDFLSDFKYIELWFEKKTSISDWQSTVAELIELQPTIKDNPLYAYHPLNAVKSESLAFLQGLLDELSAMQRQIDSTFGGIDKHLEVLKNVVMKADSLLVQENENLEFEQLIIKRLMSVVSDISSSSVVGGVDSKYFAENIRAMLKDYDSETEEDESPLKIAAVNLENMQNFKTCYFIMCEADKYPRPYREVFPYTHDICSVLSDEKFGINSLPAEKFGLDYHLKLERYLLKNVLDFTQDELIITFSEKETNNTRGISVFVENIATAFNSNIVYEKPEIEADNVLNSFTDNKTPFSFKRKNSYTLSELAIFKLCPKAYYHRQTDDSSVYLSKLQMRFYAEAIMYCDLFRRFMDYNLQNKKVYQKNDNSYISTVKNLHKESIEENARLFSFFSQYEMTDTARNVYNKIISFIENSKQYLKGNTYTVISYSDSYYQGDGYEVVVEHDNRVVDYDKKTWRMSQNNTYLEFLVLKTSDRKSELVHYKDMIKALDENNSNEDRINLVSRIIAKINIQFDSKRFANDGIERTNALVNEITQYDFSNAQPMPSNYCSYCRLNDVCLGR